MADKKGKGKVCIQAKWLIRPELIPVSKATRSIYSPLDGMLVHPRVTPALNLPGAIYTCVERGTMRVKCLAQEHNTMSPARAQARTAHSGEEHSSHEATAPPTMADKSLKKNLTTDKNIQIHVHYDCLNVILCSRCTQPKYSKYMNPHLPEGGHLTEVLLYVNFHFLPSSRLLEFATL